MNNEKMNQIIDEAYKNYNNYMTENFMETRWCKVELSPDGKSVTGRKCNREEFIIESKIQPGFSEKWGLKIEERELSLLERYELMKKLDNWVSVHYKEPKTMEYMDSQNIPAKLITITYNNEIIESYEQPR